MTLLDLLHDLSQLCINFILVGMYSEHSLYILSIRLVHINFCTTLLYMVLTVYTFTSNTNNYLFMHVSLLNVFLTEAAKTADSI